MPPAVPPTTAAAPIKIKGLTANRQGPWKWTPCGRRGSSTAQLQWNGTHAIDGCHAISANVPQQYCNKKDATRVASDFRRRLQRNGKKAIDGHHATSSMEVPQPNCSEVENGCNEMMRSAKLHSINAGKQRQEAPRDAQRGSLKSQPSGKSAGNQRSM
eukprot:1048719-Pelagomonas_calceolata.AAC.3